MKGNIILSVLVTMLIFVSAKAHAGRVEDSPYSMRLDSIIESQNFVSYYDRNKAFTMNTKYTFEYDAHGRPTENSMYIYEDGKFHLSRKMNFEQYDDKGNLIQEREEFFSYNYQGKNVIGKDSEVLINYSYDKHGNILAKKEQHRYRKEAFDLCTSYSYNSKNMLEEENVKRYENDALVKESYTEYRYAKNKLKSKSYYHVNKNGVKVCNKIEKYEYKKNGTYVVIEKLDSLGNVVRTNVELITRDVNGGVKTIADNNSRKRFVYDIHGDLVELDINEIYSNNQTHFSKNIFMYDSSIDAKEVMGLNNPIMEWREPVTGYINECKKAITAVIKVNGSPDRDNWTTHSRYYYSKIK